MGLSDQLLFHRVDTHRLFKKERVVALSEGGIRLGCHCSRRGSVAGTN